MSRLTKTIGLSLAIAIFSTPAFADLCNNRPSKWFGNQGTGAIGATGAVTASAGIGAQAAGFYTLTHATSGAVMLGSTAAGSSAAGTVGIIANTGGIIGSGFAFIMSPFVIIPAAVVAGGIVAVEGGCAHFADLKISDYDDVDILVWRLSLDLGPDVVRYEANSHAPKAAALTIRMQDGTMERFSVADLYVLEGELFAKRMLRDESLGLITYITRADLR